ncbi:MAG: ABC transporter substrate-binding protein [Oscillospiraceae bacterium]|nr:ABC transporter substrate-binding protein [Oscillospiraceae bacterium]
MKKLLSLILAASLALSLCGCGNSSEELPQESETTTATTTTAATTTEATTHEYYITSWMDDDGYIQYYEEFEDGSTLQYSKSPDIQTYEEIQAEYPDKTVLVIACIGSNRYCYITEAVNEYLCELGKDYVICFEFTETNAVYSDYCSTVGLADWYSGLKEKVDSGIQIDIISTAEYYYCIRDGLLLPLDDYLENTEVGQTLYNMMPENLWKAYRYNGTVYGINCNGSIKSTHVYYIDAALADEYGYDFSKSFTEQTDLLETIQSESVSKAVYSGFSSLLVDTSYDKIELTSGVYWDSERKTAISWLDDEDYISTLKTAFTLYNEDLLTTAYTTSYFALDCIVEYPPESGELFNHWADTDIETGEPIYKQVYAVYDDSQPVLTRDMTFCYALGVSNTSENQDMAFDFIATMLTDEELNKRMCYADYESEMYSDGRISSSAYYFSYEQFANLLLSIPTTRQPSNIAEVYKTSLEEAYVSEDFDFVFDDSEVYQQCVDVLGVMGEMTYNRLTEYTDFDEYLSDFRTLLEEAGIENIIAEANRQYTEWKESQS